MLTQVLTDDDVRRLVPMLAAIGHVRDAFAGLHRGDFNTPVSREFEGGLIIKSVVHRPTETAAVKVMTVNPEAAPFVSGVMTFLDRAGRRETVADCGTVTTLRTGAIVGVATEQLSDPDARRLVVIGAGAQAGDQIRAVCAVRPIQSVVVLDRDPARAAALADGLAGELPSVSLSAGHDVARALADADVVCCATNSREPLFDAADLPDRVHVNAIGSFRPTMRELPAELLAQATVVVDTREAALAEAGEIIDAADRGLLSENALIELGDAVSRRPPLSPSTPRTVFKTVGVAVQDWAVMWGLSQTNSTNGSQDR